MSFLESLLRRIGYIKLSTYGLELAPDGTLVAAESHNDYGSTALAGGDQAQLLGRGTPLSLPAPNEVVVMNARSRLDSTPTPAQLVESPVVDAVPSESDIAYGPTARIPQQTPQPSATNQLAAQTRQAAAMAMDGRWQLTLARACAQNGDPNRDCARSWTQARAYDSEPQAQASQAQASQAQASQAQAARDEVEEDRQWAEALARARTQFAAENTREIVGGAHPVDAEQLVTEQLIDDELAEEERQWQTALTNAHTLYQDEDTDVIDTRQPDAEVEQRIDDELAAGETQWGYAPARTPTRAAATPLAAGSTAPRTEPAVPAARAMSVSAVQVVAAGAPSRALTRAGQGRVAQDRRQAGPGHARSMPRQPSASALAPGKTGVQWMQRQATNKLTPAREAKGAPLSERATEPMPRQTVRPAPPRGRRRDRNQERAAISKVLAVAKPGRRRFTTRSIVPTSS